MGVNKVILIGNVGRDPEIKSLPSGIQLATFSLATTDKRFKDESGNPRTEWHKIVAWRKLAEICERYVTKGKQLYIEGSIRTRTYEQDGQKKYVVEIHAEEMELLGSPRSSDSGGSRERHESVAQSYPDDVDDVPF
jgi:single-strand DNA-binding protein